MSTINLDEHGFDARGIHFETQNRFGPDGFNQWGVDAEGYERDGFHVRGYDRGGFNRDGKHVIDLLGNSIPESDIRFIDARFGNTGIEWLLALAPSRFQKSATRVLCNIASSTPVVPLPERWKQFEAKHLAMRYTLQDVRWGEFRKFFEMPPERFTDGAVIEVWEEARNFHDRDLGSAWNEAYTKAWKRDERRKAR